jgi:hypothetical protein
MSKSIQDALDLPTLEDLLKAPRQTDEGEEITDEMVEEADDNSIVEEMSTALATGAVTRDMHQEREALDHAKRTDYLHDEVLQHAKDLMDLGYNVDTRSAGKIFQTAASMYKLALEAKNSKRDAQLKALRIELDERRLDQMAKQNNGDDNNNVVPGEHVIIEDRNEMIKRLREEAKGK